MLPALSGILLALAFPGLDAGSLAWIALVPLLISISQRSPREAFIRGYLSGFVAFAIILVWMRLFGIVPWLLLAAYLAIYVGVFAALLRWIQGNRSPAWSILLAPVIWTGLEYLRSIGPLGFPWASLGVSQHAAIAVLQLARVTGVYGISALVVAANAWIAWVWILAPSAVSLPLERLGGRIVVRLLQVRFLLWVAILVLAIMLAGQSGVLRPSPIQTGSLRVATLQPNVPPPLKFDPAAARNNLVLLRELIDQAAAVPTDLIVMPETALPSNIFGSGGLLAEMGAWARASRATLIATSLENGTSNIAVAVAPGGAAVDRYDKVRLVAFAESGITPGARHNPMWTPVGPLGIAICFESIFPDVSRALVRAGAEVLVVITNDAWSDGTAGPAQHARFAALRAVETGRWVVQASNSGVSEIIDPTGRVAASLPLGRPGVLRGRVGLERALTPYVRWGDWFPQLMLGLGAVAAVILRRRDILAEARLPGLQAAAAISVLPLITVLALLAVRAPWWVWMAAVFVFIAIFAIGRIGTSGPAQWGTWRSAAAAVAAGTVLVVALWGIIVLAFRANQIPAEFAAPPFGWISGSLRYLLIAAALELWLRGQVFPALAEWKGMPTAIGATTLMGMVLQAGLPAEAIAWAMVTGIGFGMIRARTGSALGLIVPHAVGTILLGFLTVVR